MSADNGLRSYHSGDWGNSKRGSPQSRWLAQPFRYSPPCDDEPPVSPAGIRTKRSGTMPPISGLFFRRFAIVRAKMWSPSAGAHQVAMVWYIKPGPKIFRSWRRVRIVASDVMNKNLFRWHCCRDMENIFNLTLGQHGSTLINACW